MCSLSYRCICKTQTKRGVGHRTWVLSELQQHELNINTCSCPESSRQNGVNSCIWKWKKSTLYENSKSFYTEEIWDLFIRGRVTVLLKSWMVWKLPGKSLQVQDHIWVSCTVWGDGVGKREWGLVCCGVFLFLSFRHISWFPEKLLCCSVRFALCR